MKGKNITVPQGTEVTAYIAADTPLDPAKFTPAALTNTMTNPTATVATDSSVTIKSSPDGAEVLIDGNFVGTTPSTIHLASGEHKVVVSKSGFKSWDRTMTVTAGSNINLTAELEKIP